jgi:hypothetical protein
MKKNDNNFNLSAYSQELLENKKVKIVAITLVGIGVLYLAGKSFTILASSVRGFNDLKSALNGK